MTPDGPKDMQAGKTRFEQCLATVGNVLFPGAGWNRGEVSGSAVRAIALS